MTLALADVDRWSVEAITTVFKAAIQRAHGTRAAAAAIGTTVVFLDWDGASAAAARAATRRTILDLDTHAEACSAVGRAAEKAAAQVAVIKARLGQIRGTADDYRVCIDNETGTTSPPANLTSLAPADQRAIADAQVRIWLAIQQLLHDARNADNDLAAAVRGCTGDLSPGKVRTEISAGPFVAPSVPVDAAGPDQVRTWWEALNPSEQDQVKRSAADSIRNRDGIPSDVRAELNLAALPREISRLRNGGLVRNGWHTDPAKLADLTALRDTLTAPANRNARLLLLDTTGDPAKVLAAVAVGDVDNAARVGVTVGGLNSRVSSSIEKMVGEAQDQRRTASLLRRDAGLTGHDAVASVAYLGYDAPDSVGEVIRDDLARAGAQPLNRFYRGLAAVSNVADSQLTAFGHSYGSLTTSLALQLGAPVADVVLYGSPGAEITRAAQLGVDPGHAYYLAASHDPVAGTLPITHRFGPALFDVAGMTELSVDAGPAADSKLHERAYGHTEYTRLGSNNELRMSGYNMAAVLAGLPDKVVRPRALAPGPIGE